MAINEQYLKNFDNILRRTNDTWINGMQPQTTSLLFLKKAYIEQIQQIKLDIENAFRKRQGIDQFYKRIDEKIKSLPTAYSRIDQISANVLQSIKKQLTKSMNVVDQWLMQEEIKSSNPSQCIWDSFQANPEFPIIKSLTKTIKENIESCKRVLEEILPKYDQIVNQIQMKTQKIMIENTNSYLQKKLQNVLSNKVGIFKNTKQVLQDFNAILKELSKKKKDLTRKKHDSYSRAILQLKQKVQINKNKVRGNKRRNNQTKIEVTQEIGIFQRKIKDLINAVVQIQQPFIEQEDQSSQFIIQPIKGTNRFIVYDILNKSRKEYHLMEDDKFPQSSMGTVHLSNSLVLAGGRSYPHCFKKVFRLFENGECDSLPDLKIMKAGMGLAALRDGQIIACVGGQTIFQGNINHAQILVKYKNWKDLPKIKGKRLEGRAVVGIDPKFIYTFGGQPFDSKNSIMGLDIDRLHKNWFTYDEIAFKRRCYDGIAHLKNQKLIIVFGSGEGERCHQIKIHRRNEIQLVERTYKTFPFNTQSFISSKVFNGELYSFDIGRQNIFKYNVNQHEWIMQDKE